MCCEGGLQLEEIGTNNVKEDELNPRLGFTMVNIYNWHITCTREVIGDRRIWEKRCSDEYIELSWYVLDSMGFKCWVKH